MPDRLLLIRHSQPQIDPGRPASQWSLTEAGRQRCAALAQRLAAYAPELLISSVEPKARETAALVAAQLGLPHLVAAGLHEHRRDHAAWLEQPAFDQAIVDFFAQPQELVFGEETAAQAGARFAAALHAVLAAYPQQTLAIVAHGTVMTLFVAACAGIAPLPFWRSLGMPAIVVLSLPELALVEVLTQVVGTFSAALPSSRQ